jgi:hypothetical protein
MAMNIKLIQGVLKVLNAKRPVDSLGYRQNNPFNISNNYRYRKDYICFPGERFLMFLFLDDGLESGYRLLLYYFKSRDTYPVYDFIKRYAEGDTNYINFLKLSLGSSTIQKDQIIELGSLITRFENGKGIDKKLLEEAFKRALKRDIW